MVATSLTLLAASLGVVYSFEPANDGSDRYDYVVQVEPELVDSLASGHSMPIGSHVPEHVSAIRSVRVVLGQHQPQAGDRVERTSYKQPSNWRQLSGNGTAQNYGNNPAANSSTPTVQPPRLLGAMQETGSAMVQGTRSGLQRAGQNLQSASQHLGSAADDLTGGTLSRVGDAIREPFQDSSAPGTQNATQSMENTARDYANVTANDTREQFDQAGQSMRGNTGSAVAATDYRSQGDDSSTMPPAGQQATAGAGGQSVQGNSVQGNRGPADPGQNPFANQTSQETTNGPSFGSSPRYQANPNAPTNRQAAPAAGSTAQPANTTQNRQNPGPTQQPAMVPVLTSDNWQNQQQQADQYRSTGSQPGALRNNGQANTPASQNNAEPYDPWTNSRVANSPAQAGVGGNTPTGQYANQPSLDATNETHQVNSPSDQGGEQTRSQAAAEQPPAEKPWGPLMGTGVALIGSLGANLFLGFSFLDARHKYLSAIRRGARSFGRYESERT